MTGSVEQRDVGTCGSSPQAHGKVAIAVKTDYAEERLVELEEAARNCRSVRTYGPVLRNRQPADSPASVAFFETLPPVPTHQSHNYPKEGSQ